MAHGWLGAADKVRGRVEWCRPWWRRDVLVMALQAAYPLWLTAPQIGALCAEIEPRYRHCSRFVTARSLGRLHSYRDVDRIGHPAGFHAGNRKSSVPGAGYRYRLRKV